ncbi:MAG: hypothetical protein SO365_00690 [Prevotella sp.]|nr:hypothetical protein [Prevotella sp.]MDY4951697.1 hypothetical protein [Prevotella sp.]
MKDLRFVWFVAGGPKVLAAHRPFNGLQAASTWTSDSRHFFITL